MTQAGFDFTAPPEPPRVKRVSLTEQMARYFAERPHVWIDARALLAVGGFAAWRTRLSELREAPWSMVIENRTRREHGYTVSEYRYLAGGVPGEAHEER